LRFASGGTAQLRVARADDGETRLEIGLEGVDGSFAALRSMFVAADNNDTAEIDRVQPDGTTAAPQSVMSPLAAPVTRIRFTRSTVSRHNSSAPDMVFGDFGR
jgi:hypothetical protein